MIPNAGTFTTRNFRYNTYMQYTRSDHTFDWTGFRFALKLLAFCVVVGSAGHFALPYAQSVYASADSSADQFVVQKSVAPHGTFSTTTPQRVIKSLTIAEAVPPAGKFLVADLSTMKLSLYQDGASTAEYPIQTKGKSGSPWETPAGFYSIQTKEVQHFSTIGHVYMPYSMEFYGNYFIHGWPYYEDGEPVSSSYSGGCIRLDTEDAAKVFAFADQGTGLFVYDPAGTASTTSIALGSSHTPSVSAESYLVADLDTGDVYLEHNAQTRTPIASVTKLITALVANEAISFDKKISVPEGRLLRKDNLSDTRQKKFPIGDLLYPLLMESSNGVALALADYYGQGRFVQWMNETARALDMQSTQFAEPSGLSPDNVSTSDDLFRLAAYLSDKKSFIWDITRTPSKRLVASDGTSYTLTNYNRFFGRPDFIGGKVGYTDEADHTMVSVFSILSGTETHRVAFIVLQSNDYAADTQSLLAWFTKAVAQGAKATGAASAAGAQPQQHRKIEI